MSRPDKKSSARLASSAAEPKRTTINRRIIQNPRRWIPLPNCPGLEAGIGPDGSIEIFRFGTTGNKTLAIFTATEVPALAAVFTKAVSRPGKAGPNE